MLEVRTTLNLVKQFEGQSAPLKDMCAASGWTQERLSHGLMILTRIHAIDLIDVGNGRHALKLTDRGVRLLEALNAPNATGIRDVGSDDKRIAEAFALLQGYDHDLAAVTTTPTADHSAE